MMESRCDVRGDSRCLQSSAAASAASDRVRLVRSAQSEPQQRGARRGGRDRQTGAMHSESEIQRRERRRRRHSARQQ